jgi:hypothetical protein
MINEIDQPHTDRSSVSLLCDVIDVLRDELDVERTERGIESILEELALVTTALEKARSRIKPEFRTDDVVSAIARSIG